MKAKPMRIQTTHYFDASHQLPDSPDLFTKKCAQLHGHTYKAKVTIEGENNRSGMVIDFGKIKETVNVLDHKHINDIFSEYGIGEPATAENIAIFLKYFIGKQLALEVLEVSICEGYKGDEHSNWVTV